MSARRQRKAAGQSKTASTAGNTQTALLCCLALAALALVAYGNSFNAGLLVDNRPIIIDDPRVHSWNADTLKLIFTRDYWWPDHTSELYRPLTTFSYWVNYTLLGGETDVTGYHVVNFILHWANAAMTFLIVRHLSRRTAVAFVAAALFVVHPITTEAVTNVIGRADLLATLSVLMAGWFYIRAAQATERHVRVTALAAAGLCALAGVFMKETAVLVGAFVLLYDWLWRWPLIAGATTGERLKSAVATFGPGYVAFVPAAIAAIIVRENFGQNAPLLSQIFVDNPITGASWFTGVMTAWSVIGRYQMLLLFPRTLSSDYSFEQIPLYGSAPLHTVAAWLALSSSIAIIVLAVRYRRANPVRSWGVLFFFLMMVVTSNLVMPIGSIMAERFMYLPAIGVCACAASLLIGFTDRLVLKSPAGAPITVRAIVAMVLVALVWRTHLRNADWRDEFSLWKSALAASPNSYRAHRGYASALINADRREGTIDSVIAVAERGQKIIDTLPMDRRTNTLQYDLGTYYRLKAQRFAARGQTADATVFMRRAVDHLLRAQEIDEFTSHAYRDAQLKRGHDPGSIPDTRSAPIYLELGDAYLALRETAKARDAAKLASAIRPAEVRAYQIDGVALFYEQKYDSAAIAFAAALTLDPRRTDLWRNLKSVFRADSATAPIVESGNGFAFDLGDERAKELVRKAKAHLKAAEQTK